MSKHFGNLQRIRQGKRTYGITPHIVGGFITPENLEKIARVAKKYNGAIKITSGQRILISNLKEEDLNQIWEELDMEPAVESQNSVKNVEICPAGLCKRVKYNTIAIGMKLSRKYQKMEMPCRTKIGVAGCRNACGSVYSKDIGIIADVNKLLMISLGGSAGFNPRLADIIYRDLTEEETLDKIEKIIDKYKELAEEGEKLGHMIDRIGLEEFKNRIDK